MIGNYAPYEAYRIVLMGDDLSHLTKLLSDGMALHEDCRACDRFRRAVAVAEYHEIPERAA